jgi:hypothetical protein
MALQDLTSDEQKIVLDCLNASVEGPFFPDWEFSTLFGLSQEEVRSVIQKWPVDDTSDETAALAINNTLNNLLGYPHQENEAWRQYISASQEEVYTIFKKWRGHDVNQYFDGMR